jgi:hypothetical protein
MAWVTALVLTRRGRVVVEQRIEDFRYEEN